MSRRARTPEPRPQDGNAVRRAFVVCLVGLLLSACGAWLQSTANTRQVTDALAAEADRLATRLTESIRLYQYGLRGMRGAAVTAGENGLNQRVFDDYSSTRDIESEFPGALGFGLIRRVAQADEAAFVARAQRDSHAGFAEKALAPHDGDRYVIEFIGPLAPNRAAVGLDIASEPERRAAAYAALTSGQLRLTAPITLVQTSGDRHQGFLLLLPVYRGGRTPATVGERLERGWAWSYAPLNINQVLARDVADASALQLLLADVTDPGKARIFYATPKRSGDAPPVLTRHIQREVFGRRWDIAIGARPAFVAALNQTRPINVFGIGALISLLSALLAGTQAVAQARRRQARIEEAHLAAIVENANDAIIGNTLDGRVTSWNRAAERIYGYTAAQAIGRPLVDLVVPPGYEDEESRLIDLIAHGERVPGFDTRRHHRDGRLIDVSVTASPVCDEEGRVVGIAKTVRDISAQKAAEARILALNAGLEAEVAARTAELDAARRALQTVLDAVPSMIGYWDRDLTNRVANHAYYAWFGVSPGKLQGRRLDELLGPELFALNRPYVEAVLRGEPQTFERSIPRPDGRGVRHSLAHYLPDTVDGEVRGFYAIVHDVTEITESRLRLADALRENRILLRTINEQLLYSVTDADGQIIEINDNFCRVSGYSREALLGRTHAVMNSGVRPAAPWDDIWATLTAGRPWHGEICNRARDGSLYWLDSVIAPFLDDDGGIIRYVSLHSDITYRKEAEAELERVHTLLGNVLTAASEVSIIATDPEGTIQIFNSGAERMLGYTAGELVGRHTPALIHREDEVAARGQALSAQYDQTIEGFRVFVHEAERHGSDTRQWTYVRRDGSRLQVSLVVTAMRDTEGRVVGYLGIAEDITERLRASEAQRQAREAAEAANAAKSQFLANVSHEIRTPMNAVIGIAHLLEDTPLDDDQQQLLTKLQIAGRTLLGIINDVLDLAKIEAGEMQLDLVPLHPLLLLDEIVALHQPQAAARGLAFGVTGTDSLPQSVVADSVRLRQILTNLVGNALKFTERGGIFIDCGCVPAGPGQVQLTLAVRDTGCGIAPEVRSRLFKPFSQADDSITRQYGGTGLGLSIVRRLTTLMGGEITLESTPGEGSTFRVTLPLTLGEQSAAASQSGLELLVFDHDAADLENLLRLCRALGWRARGHTSAQSLVDELRVLRENAAPLPDALLLDQPGTGTPVDLTGQPLADLFRSGLPVVALLDAGEIPAPGTAPDALLTRPVNSSALFNALNTAVASHGGTGLVLAATALGTLDAHWLDGVRILLVDDSEINLDVARRLLEREGATVRTSANGAEAVDTLRADPDACDIVLMDVQMPVMDGYSATRAIRDALGLTRLPVLALTAGALAEERRRADDAGMDGFLTKPLDPEQMVRAIRRILEERSGRPLPVAAGRGAPEPDAVWPAIDGIDLDAVRTRIGDSPDFYYAQLERLLQDYRDIGDTAGLHARFDSEPEALAARLHKLRGAASLLGAAQVHPLAGAIELALRGQAPDTDPRPLLEQLSDAMRALEAAAEPVLGARRAAARMARPTGAGADAYTLRALVAHLRQHDFAAVQLFEQAGGDLPPLLGETRYTQLQHAMDRLDFPRALELLAPYADPPVDATP